VQLKHLDEILDALPVVRAISQQQQVAAFGDGQVDDYLHDCSLDVDDVVSMVPDMIFVLAHLGHVSRPIALAAWRIGMGRYKPIQR
jgi:predicted TIM-barrel fold metal-dependent hydrolase